MTLTSAPDPHKRPEPHNYEFGRRARIRAGGANLYIRSMAQHRSLGANFRKRSIFSTQLLPGIVVVIGKLSETESFKLGSS